MENKEAFTKLLSVQSILKAPKGQYNEFSNFNYRSCEDILNALKPILKKFNAVVVITDEIVLIGERYYIKATAHFIDTVTGGEIHATAYAREQQAKKGMDESQITGAASSYARKYALNGLFAIDNTKDADSMNNNDTEADTPAESVTKYFCKDCGAEIMPQAIKGKKYTADTIARSTKKKYGRAVCLKCANAIEAEAKEIQN